MINDNNNTLKTKKGELMCSIILGETTCSCFDCYVATGDFDFDMTIDENPYTDELVVSEMIQKKKTGQVLKSA